MESSNYRITNALTSGGENSSSINYYTYTAFAETIIGNSSSNNFKVYLGFFLKDIDTDKPRINFIQPSQDNSTLVAKWLNENISALDTNLYYLNCTIYNSTNDIYLSKSWDLTYYTAYNVLNFTDISTWPLGLYYENCTALDITSLSIPPSENSITSEIVEFEVLPLRNYGINLTSGINVTYNWSLISSPLMLINKSYKSFTSSVYENWSFLATYINNGTKWLFAAPFGSDFDDINFTLGYWIKMKENDTLEIEGVSYQDSVKNRTVEIPLTLGWNIIPYLYDYPQNLSIVLSSISGKWKSIWRYCNPYCTTLSGNITGWLGQSADSKLPEYLWDIKQLEPGVGYEIYINETCTLVYNFTANEHIFSGKSVSEHEISQAKPPAVFFGNLTRDGKPAPIGTKIRAFKISGQEYPVEYNISTKIGEYGNEGIGMKVYDGDDGDKIIFKINNFTANNGTFWNFFNHGRQQLDIFCTNCNNLALLTNYSLSNEFGNRSSTFSFSVFYKDIDNDAPIWVNLTVDNVSYKMFGNYSNATLQDELKVNGRLFTYNLSGFSMGQHTYKFSAYDNFNITETPLQTGPAIFNLLPILTNAQVSQKIGNNFDTYNFSVVYIDYDNDTPEYVNLTLVNSENVTYSYQMYESDIEDNDVKDGKEYFYNKTLSPGVYSFYFLAYDGYNKTQTTSQKIIVGKLIERFENLTANYTNLINLSEANIIFEILPLENITDANINLTLFTENPTEASFAIPGIREYMRVDISPELNATLSSFMLKVYYTDEEISAKNLNESSLRFYWFNESLAEWIALDETWDWVYGTGVNTEENFVWANLSHLSYFKIGGENLQISYTIPLQQGWNLISIPLNLMT
ncbi:MAG: hypothetical protein QXY62_00960 [Candidatus Altiarchaeota archaeon]